MAVDENEAGGISLSSYGRVLWRGKWIIAATTIILLGLAMAYVSTKTPMYQASTQLIYETQLDITQPLSSGQYVDPTQYQADISSITSVIQSPEIVKSAEALMASGGGAQSSYSVSAAPDAPADQSSTSNTVTVAGVSDNPQIAAKAANAYAQAFVAYRKASVQATVKQAEAVVRSRLDSYRTVASRQTGDYAILQQRLQDLQILEATATGNFRILVPANPPGAPFSPRKFRTGAMGLVGGFAIDAILVLLLAQFDTRVRTPEEAAALLDLPVLGHIRKSPAAEIDKQPLVVLADSHSPAAEAIRKLQWGLEYADIDRVVKSVFVTSCLQGEGKSVTVCNLALSLAASGKRVVLVDADLRRPRVHTYLNLRNSYGLSTVLAGRTLLQDALHERLGSPSISSVRAGGEVEASANGGQRLHVLTSGPLPPNAADLISSRRFASLIQELQDQFEMVLIDAPALLAVGDCEAISGFVGGMVFLVDITRARRPVLIEAVAQMNRMPCRKLGLVVVTRTPSRRYEHSHYHYYSHQEAKSKVDAGEVVRA